MTGITGWGYRCAELDVVAVLVGADTGHRDRGTVDVPDHGRGSLLRQRWLVTRLTIHLGCTVVKDVMAAGEGEAHAPWLRLWRPRPIIERKVWLWTIQWKVLKI